MAVEDNNGGNSSGGDSGFSEIGVGMRVLAVDDDPTCLAVLEGLLRKCKYRVTVTNQAIKALNLLREDKTRFDLVISDVSMPDMDGFKLLELVGIEMDLPVIMLSQYSDKEFVYRGVTHGAVDYLVKPVKLDMLQNIWQHVIRKKKPNPGDQNNSADNRGQDVVGDGGKAVASSGSTDHNVKLNRKRKDQEDEEDEGSDDNENEKDEHGNQKKPRVVWSVDLHKKFVAAVNQLGFDKAVPKKILDLMNVEGLTRENVASHLQKYRLYLKRLSVVPPPQGKMVYCGFGSRDAAFLRMGSMDGFGDFRSLSGPGRVSSTSLTSYMPGGISARLNTSGGLTLRGIANSGLLQGHLQSSSNSLNIPGKLQPTLLAGNQATSTFHGGSSFLQPSQLHGNNSNLLGEFNANDDKSGFMIASGLANTISNVPGNHLMLQVNSQQNQNRGSFGNQPSLSVPSSNQQSFEVGISGSSSFMDQGRCNGNFQIAVQLSKFPSTTTPINEYLNHEQLSAHNLRDNISTASSLISNNPIDFSGSNYLPPSLDSKVDAPNTNYASKQRWDDLSQANNASLVSPFGNLNSMVSSNAFAGPLLQGMDQRKKHEGPFIGQINAADPLVYQHAEPERQKPRSNNGYLLDQTKSQNSFDHNNYDGLDDLMNTMIKRDPSESILMDNDFAFDSYSP